MREKEKKEKENVALKPIWLEDIRCKVIHNRLRLLLLNRYENSKTPKQHSSQHTSNTTYSRNNKKRSRSIDERLQDVSMRDSKNNSNNSNNNDEINENLTSNYLQYTPLQMTNLMMGYAFPTVREYELCIETAVLHTIDHHRPNDQITPTNDVRIKWLTPVVDKMSCSFVLLRLKENDRNGENKQEVLRLEQLLKNVLSRLDGIESGHALHTVAVDSMLSTDDSFGIPAWLINSMQVSIYTKMRKRERASRNMEKHGRFSISIPSPSFKLVSLSLSRSSLILKHPNKSFLIFNPINIFDIFLHTLYFTVFFK